MTIRKGVDWGVLAPVPPGLVLVRSDAELRTHVVRSRATHVPIGPVGLLGGDLMRTVGGTGDPQRFTDTADVAHLRVDVVRIIADEARTTWFAAHCVARRSWWVGQLTGAFNAQFLGPWDVTPRGHPNDGKVDVIRVDAEFAVQQRLIARKRVRLGTHIPHPQISIRPMVSTSIQWDRAQRIWLDGQRWGSARHVELVVEPDALVVCV